MLVVPVLIVLRCRNKTFEVTSSPRERNWTVVKICAVVLCQATNGVSPIIPAHTCRIRCFLKSDAVWISRRCSPNYLLFLKVKIYLVRTVAATFRFTNFDFIVRRIWIQSETWFDWKIIWNLNLINDFVSISPSPWWGEKQIASLISSLI